jgi:hypothetical protein
MAGTLTYFRWPYHLNFSIETIMAGKQEKEYLYKKLHKYFCEFQEVKLQLLQLDCCL